MNDVQYFPDIDSIISCSNDYASSLVISKSFGQTNVKNILRDIHLEKKFVPLSNFPSANQKIDAKKHLSGDEIVMKIHKGVKSFDFNRSLNILATGSLFNRISHFSIFDTTA